MDIKFAFEERGIVRKRFGDIDTDSSFFDSFKEVYAPYYFQWLDKKKNDDVYIVEEANKIIGFLKLKEESAGEDYTDIHPALSPAKRLKISSLKVSKGQSGLGRRFMEIVFSEAINKDVEEIYGTVAIGTPYYEEIDGFLKKWGFSIVAQKRQGSLTENVYLRPVEKSGLLSILCFSTGS